jgi:hypothetical protein
MRQSKAETAEILYLISLRNRNLIHKLKNSKGDRW